MAGNTKALSNIKIDNKIHKKNKHLTIDDREALASCLLRGLNLTDTAKYLNCNISTIKKEIERNRILVTNNRYKNKCGYKNECLYNNICGNNKCTHLCNDCRNPLINCNSYCRYFNQIPKCKKLKHLCGVCNGCDTRQTCNLNHWIYKYTDAQKVHELNIIEARKGIRISNEELRKFTNFIIPLIKNNLSLDTIKAKFPDMFPYSIQTVYNWIDHGYIIGVDNIMLPRKVRYSRRKEQNQQIKNDFSHLTNRLYEDFISYITDNPYDEVVEMDTVEGYKKHSFILTLLFRRSNFMLAFKLLDHTAKSIVDVFNDIKQSLGLDVFKKHFKVILTDRGKEFTLPHLIEFDSEGNRLTRIFYCDSRQSQQKGKIEKNHEELRKICPKGFDFNSINQTKLNLVLQHVNSYPRKILNYKSPFELFKAFSHPKLLELNDSKAISFQNIILNPNLLK